MAPNSCFRFQYSTNSIKTTANIRKKIPVHGLEAGAVISEGRPGRPESAELNINATKRLLTKCTPMAVSRPLSTRVMIPNIRPIRKVEITMDRLWSRLVPLKKCTSPNMADVTSKGMTGPLEMRLIPCIRYPLKSISSKEVCTGKANALKTSSK